jgi:hypothetical protein
VGTLNQTALANHGDQELVKNTHCDTNLVFVDALMTMSSADATSVKLSHCPGLS